MTAASQTTLAILAGGAGTRMGLPKSHLTLHDTPILEYLHHQFSWPGPTLLITTPGLEHPPGHHLFTTEVPDPVPNQGPLRALLTALEHCATPLLLVTTVDMPNITPHHFHHLITMFNAHPTAAALMLHRTIAGSQHLEPFPSIYRLTAKEIVATHLRSPDRSLRALTEDPHVVALPAPTHWRPDTWTNLNHPDDLAAFLTPHEYPRRQDGRDRTPGP